MKTVFFAALAMGLSICAARAENISAVTGEQLENALAAAGLNPTMEGSANGAPVAVGSAGEFQFYVRALACTGTPASCENLVFFANFDLGRPPSANDYRIVNRYNDSQVFGRAYVLQDQNQVGVDYVIELGGGVSEEHLAENIGRWADVITAFVNKFREGLASS